MVSLFLSSCQTDSHWSELLAINSVRFLCEEHVCLCNVPTSRRWPHRGSPWYVINFGIYHWLAKSLTFFHRKQVSRGLACEKTCSASQKVMLCSEGEKISSEGLTLCLDEDIFSPIWPTTQLKMNVTPLMWMESILCCIYIEPPHPTLIPVCERKAF